MFVALLRLTACIIRPVCLPTHCLPAHTLPLPCSCATTWHLTGAEPTRPPAETRPATPTTQETRRSIHQVGAGGWGLGFMLLVGVMRLRSNLRQSGGNYALIICGPHALHRPVGRMQALFPPSLALPCWLNAGSRALLANRTNGSGRGTVGRRRCAAAAPALLSSSTTETAKRYSVCTLQCCCGRALSSGTDSCEMLLISAVRLPRRTAAAGSWVHDD